MVTSHGPVSVFKVGIIFFSKYCVIGLAFWYLKNLAYLGAAHDTEGVFMDR